MPTAAFVTGRVFPNGTVDDFVFFFAALGGRGGGVMKFVHRLVVKS